MIAGRVASLPEVVGDAGMLVDLGDPDALAAAMLRLYRDAALPRVGCSALSLARAARFSWDRCTRETLAAYRAVRPNRSIVDGDGRGDGLMESVKSDEPLRVLYLIADHTRMAGANRSVLELIRHLPPTSSRYVVVTAPEKWRMRSVARRSTAK